MESEGEAEVPRLHLQKYRNIEWVQALLLLEEDEELEDELSMLGISKSTVTKISSSIWQAVQTTERFGFDSR